MNTKLLRCLTTTASVMLIICSCSGDKGCMHGEGKQLTDSVYIAGNYKIPGELFHGADGYDYYVAHVYGDSVFTYDQALTLEKDGWVLPKSLGYYATTVLGKINGQKMEYRTVDTDSDDPVIERMVGNPRLLVSVLPDLTYQQIIGFGEFWTSTPIGTNNAAYYTVRQAFNGTQMSSITDTGDPKSTYKMAVLVKRIERPNTVFYNDPISKRRFPARNINGYEVVDPSGGLNFNYNTPATIYDDGRPNREYPDGINYIDKYEQNGWELPDYEALSKIFNTSVETKSTAIAPANPIAQRLFPPSDSGRRPEYLGRDSQGEFFTYTITYHPEENSIRIQTRPAPRTPVCVRLVKLPNQTGASDNTEDENPENPNQATSADLNLLGLKGPVESVSYKREGADAPYRTVKFDIDGYIAAPSNIRIKRDNNNRIVKYEQFVGPDSEDNFEFTFKYEDIAGNPLSYEDSNIGSYSSVTFKYDKEGNLIQSTTESAFEGSDDTSEINRDYIILATDDYGNWTKRRVNEESIENYMIENAMGEYSPRQHSTTESYIELRTIKYRK